MSKSYGNTIDLADSADTITKKVKPMVTDPARRRRTDPGNPDVCPVFDLHKIFTPPDARQACATGCRTAGIGCLECKKPLIDKVVEEISGIRKRAQEFEENPELVRNIVAEGSEKAREAARATLDEVRRVMYLRVD
jgi:tryptophanyl-tRNA synthetase